MRIANPIALKSESHRCRTSTIVAALLPALMLWSTTAHPAVVGAAALSMLPSPITVGQTGFGVIDLTNINSGPEASLPDTVDLILLTPACLFLTNGVCAAGNQDPLVLKLIGQGAGLSGTTCANQVFTISLINATLDLWQLASAAPVTLGPGATCSIMFSYNVLNQPRASGAPGIRTALATVSARFTANGQQVPASGSSGNRTFDQGCSLDFDGNGSIDALTDGLLVLRAMFGLTGNAVSSGTVAGNATRATWDALQRHMNKNCGANFSP